MELTLELKQKIGQLFIVGFDGYIASNEIKKLIKDYHVGHVILFSRNVQSVQQLCLLNAELQHLAKDALHTLPLIIAADQENGVVTRFKPPMVPQFPGSMTLAATGDLTHARTIFRYTGEVLKGMGVNWNLAPVADVNNEPDNPVIGARSPSDDPHIVATFVREAYRGLADVHCIPSIKHYPGHGDTKVDSHLGLPVIEKTMQQLEECEMIPFRQAAADQVGSIMLSHIALPLITHQADLPTSLSKTMIQYLRETLQYSGIIVTDCFEMDAIKDGIGVPQGAVMTLQGGTDIVMICHTYENQSKAIERVYAAVQSGEIDRAQIEDAYERVVNLKRDNTSWEHDLIKKDPDQVLDSIIQKNAAVQHIYEQSTTLVRDADHLIPLKTEQQVLVLLPPLPPTSRAVDDTRDPFSKLGDALLEHSSNVRTLHFGTSKVTRSLFSDEIKASDFVILVSMNVKPGDGQTEMKNLILEHKIPFVALASCNPYDYLHDEAVRTYLCTYEYTKPAFQAAAKVIYGLIKPKGKLPVQY